MRLSLEHVQQRVRMRCKKILPTQVADDAVARAAVVPVGLHQPDVLVNSAVGAFHFRGSKVHGVHLSRVTPLEHWILEHQGKSEKRTEALCPYENKKRRTRR